LAREDLIQVEGKVVEASGGGTYRILLTNGTTVSARLCGKMKRFKIKVILGDNVTVGLSPYDLTHGFILLRHKS
jgi:translation initiation factor IF-1